MYTLTHDDQDVFEITIDTPFGPDGVINIICH